MDTTIFSDPSLLLRARENEPEALAAIFGQMTGLVASIAASYYLAGGDQDDLLQEGFIGLLRAVRTYDSTRCDSFEKYAKICIHRSILSAIKSASRKKHAPLNDSVEISDQLPQQSANPEDLFVMRENLVSMYAMIDIKLTPLERSVLDLYVEGLSHKEIAARLSKNCKAVDNALSRIRNKLL